MPLVDGFVTHRLADEVVRDQAGVIGAATMVIQHVLTADRVDRAISSAVARPISQRRTGAGAPA